MKPWWSYFFTP